MDRIGWKHLQDLPAEELTWPIVNARKLNGTSIAYLENLPKQIDFLVDDIAYSLQQAFKDLIP